MKELGQRLKNTRLEKNLTLEDISAQTKIQLSILKRIEDGNAKDLPHEAHLRGFIRQYAKILGLDSEEVLNMMNSSPVLAQTAIKFTDETKAPDEKTNVLWFRAPSRLITMVGLVIAVVLIISIYSLSMKIDSYSQETFQSDANNEEQPTEKIPLEGGLTLPAADSTSPTEQPATPAQAEPKMVSVEAFEDVSINALWSTGKTEKIVLKVNRKHTFYYSDRIKLEISNAGAVNVVTSKKSLGIPGELGQPIALAFD